MGSPVHRPDGLAMLMSPKKGETAAKVMSVLIIGEVIQAASRQVSSIIRSKLEKRKNHLFRTKKYVFRASLFKLIQQTYYTLEKIDCKPLQVSLILPIRSFLYIWSICYVGFKTYK